MDEKTDLLSGYDITGIIVGISYIFNNLKVNRHLFLIDIALLNVPSKEVLISGKICQLHNPAYLFVFNPRRKRGVLGRCIL